MARLIQLRSLGLLASLGISCTETEPTPLELNGPPASVSILSGDGQTGPSGSPLAQALTVLVRDEAGQAVPAVEVRWTATGGTLSATIDSTDDDGRASVQWTMPDTPGSYAARAAVAGLAEVSFTGRATPGLPFSLALVSGDEQKEIVGTLLDPLVVVVKDQEGKPVPGVVVTWKATGGQLSAALDSTGADGTASVGWTLPQTPGTYTVEASASSLEPVQFSALAAPELVFRYLDAGSYHSCGITTTEELYCWGYNGDGQAGDSLGGYKMYPTKVERAERFRAVSGGRYHTCGITLSGEVVCWGASRDSRTAGGGAATYQYVQAGQVHTCGITLSKELWCWGYNGEAELGRDTSSTSWGPGKSAGPDTVGTPYFPYRSVAVGGLHSCGIMLDGTARCWGYGAEGQVGVTGSPRVTPVPTLVAGAFRVEPFPVVSEPPGPPDSLPPGPFIAAGFAHTCGITSSGGLLCWGLNEKGQLGNGGYSNSPTPTAVSAPAATFKQITAGNSHTCAITVEGTAYCWGENRYGQLGDGTRSASRPEPTLVLGGLKFAYIKAGELSTCGLTTAGVGYCWGDNEYGQLGLGTRGITFNRPQKVAFQR